MKRTVKTMTDNYNSILYVMITTRNETNYRNIIGRVMRSERPDDIISVNCVIKLSHT